MEKKDYIAIETICQHHRVSDSFIISLGEYGLIEIDMVNKVHCIPKRQLSEVERFVRLHQDLQLNPEGIDVICHLSRRLEQMQQHIALLKKRLELYEEGD